ncbi:MAG: hypothetical protein WC833_13880 [Bacteroidales bacterium]|jgi:hypothetical protein
MKNLENISLDNWLAVLRPYQRNSIEILIQKHGEEKAAEIWITANGPSNIAQFGGKQQPSQPFFENFKTEFKKFVCGHPDYESFRKQLKAESKVINAIYISVISGAIGATLGFAPALLSPAVAILLSAVGKMGIQAYCTGFNADPPVIIKSE